MNDKATTTLAPKLPKPFAAIKDYKLSDSLREELNLPSYLFTGELENWGKISDLLDQYFEPSLTFVENAQTLLKTTSDSLKNITESKTVIKAVGSYCTRLDAYLQKKPIRSQFIGLYAAKKAKWREAKSKENLQTETSITSNKLITRRVREIGEESPDEEESNKKQKIDEPPEDEIEKDDSFHSIDYHPRRTQKYMLTNICRDYESLDDETDWILNDINISKELAIFGQRSLELNDKMDSLSDRRLLALDHIYIFSSSLELSCAKYLGQSMFDKITMDITPQDADMFPEVSQQISKACMDISMQSTNTNWLSFMKFAGGLISKTLDGGPEDILYASIIYKLATIIHDISHCSATEDTFIHNFVHSIFSSMFSCDKYFQQEWANCTLESNSAYKPDWIASIKPWKKKYNIIVAEIKPPSKVNRGVISDFAKLGRQMKLMLDELVESGIEDPESFGLLVKGGSLTLYRMDLKFPGLYRLIEMDELSLATEFKDFIQLSRTLPILYRFKERALGLVKRLEVVELEKAKGKTIKAKIPQSWLRSSADPKIHVTKL